MKKLLSLVLICAMGFGMISCVESEESPSVENVRNAKAEQLKAYAEYYKAQAQAEIITAEANAAYKAAETAYKQAQTDEIENRVAEAKAKFAYEIEKIKAEYEAAMLEAMKEAKGYEKDILEMANDKIESLYATYSGYVTSLNDANRSLLNKKIDLARVEAALVDVTEAANKEIEDNTALIEELEAKLAILTDNGYSQMDKDSLEAEYFKALAAYYDANYNYQLNEKAAYEKAKKAAEKASTDFFESIKKKNAELRGASGYGDIIATTTTTGDDYWTGVGTGTHTTIVYYWEKKVLLFDLVDDDNDPSTPEVEQPVMWDDDNDPSTPEVQKFDLVECNEGDEGAYRPQYNGNYIIKDWRTDWYNYTENSFNSILSVDLNERRLASFKNSAVNNYNDNVKTQEDAEKALADVKAAQTAAKGFEKAFADADAARKAIEAFKEAYAKYDEAGETVKAKEDALVATKKDTIATGPYLTLINANAALDVLTNKDNEEYGKDGSLVKALADAKAALAALPTTATAAEKAAAEGAVTTAQNALNLAIYQAEVEFEKAKANERAYADKVAEAEARVEKAEQMEKDLLAANIAATEAVETLNKLFGEDGEFDAFLNAEDEEGNDLYTHYPPVTFSTDNVQLLANANGDEDPDLDLTTPLTGKYLLADAVGYTYPDQDYKTLVAFYEEKVREKTDAVSVAENGLATGGEWATNWDAKEAELRAFVASLNEQIAAAQPAVDAYNKAVKAASDANDAVTELENKATALSTLASDTDLNSKINDLNEAIDDAEEKIETIEGEIETSEKILAGWIDGNDSTGEYSDAIAWKEKKIEDCKSEIARYEAQIKYLKVKVEQYKALLDAAISAENAAE